jgi:Putative phage tail protein
MGGQRMVIEAQKADSIRFQSSMFGAAVAVLHGRNAISPNLLSYSGFTAIRHESTERMGGKGGGKVTNVTYTYTADIVMGLCVGECISINRIWRGKTRHDDMAKAFFINDGGSAMWQGGALGQTVPSSLDQMAAAPNALGYSGVSAVWVQDYNLGDSPSVDNHRVELTGPGAYTVHATLPDAACYFILSDWITSATRGMGQADVMGSLTAYEQYTRAAGVWLSPALQDQQPAFDRLKLLQRVSNSAMVEVDGLIHMVPLAGENCSITLGSDTYSWAANPVPQYELTPDHLLDRGDDEPLVGITRTTGADAYNVVEVEYRDRNQDYAPVVARKVDQASVDVYGEKVADKLVCDWIADPGVADRVAQFELARYQAQRNTYVFELPAQFALLVPSAIVTLTVPEQGLEAQPVRITRIEETDAGYQCEAEDFIATVGSQPLHTLPVINSYRHDYAVAPGDTTVHAVIEAPASMADDVELWLAAYGGADWGGCHVWLSMDGSTYRQMGTFNGRSRVGVLSAPALSAANTLAVSGLNDQLGSGTALDAAMNATLCWVEGEFVAYQAAALTGAGAYTLSGVVRGLHGTRQRAHAAGEKFVRCDTALAKVQGLGLQAVGRQVWIKCQSFNTFGLATQDLDTLTPTTYTITGQGALHAEELVNLVPEGRFGPLPVGQRPNTWAGGTVVDVAGQPFTRALECSALNTLGLSRFAPATGDTFWLQCSLQGSTEAGVTTTVGVQWYDAADTALAFSTVGTAAAGAAWASVAGGATPPAGAAYGVPSIKRTGAAGVSRVAELVVVRQALTAELADRVATEVSSVFLASCTTDGASRVTPTTTLPVLPGTELVLHCSFNWYADASGLTSTRWVRGRATFTIEVLNADGSTGAFEVIGGTVTRLLFGEQIGAGAYISRSASASFQVRITSGASVAVRLGVSQFETGTPPTLAATVENLLGVVEVIKK